MSKTKSWSPLLYNLQFASYKDAELTKRCLDFIIRGDCVINKRTTDSQQTALMLSINRQLESLAMVIIEAGADLNIEDKDGRTALIHAGQNRMFDVAKMILMTSIVDISSVKDFLKIVDA